MIYSIEIDGQTVPLAAHSIAQDSSANLFSADSMMLIIGPNGSGKTTLLGRIAQSVLQGDSLDASDSYDVSGLHVVYLTLSPFAKPDLGSPHPNLRMLSRDRSKDPIVPTQRVLSVLAKEFDLDADAELHIDDRVGPMLREMQTLIHRSVRDRQLMAPDALAQKIRAAEQAKATIHQMRLTNLMARREIESPEHNEYLKALNETTNALEVHLTNLFGKRTKLHLRALWSALPTDSAARRTRALRSIMEKFGFKISKIKPNKAFAKKFEDELEFWESFGSSLVELTKDPYLLKSRYRFGVERLTLLPQLELFDLAKVSLAGASSGLSALVSQFTSIDGSVVDIVRSSQGQKPNLLLLLDEGDVFLHTEWQQKYVKALNSYLAKLKLDFGFVQVVMATHSPVMMSDFPRDHILRLKSRRHATDENESLAGSGWEDRFENVEISFGAPLETIVRETGGAGTMGSFAEGVIEKLIDDLRAGKKVSQARIEMIDDPMLRRLLRASEPRNSAPRSAS